MSLKRKTGAEQEARLARQEVEGLTQARDWSVFLNPSNLSNNQTLSKLTAVEQ